MVNAAKILITGASGLVGKAVLELLSAEGKATKALVFDDSKIDKSLQNVEWVVADILDVDLLDETVQGVSEVYHCLDYTSFLASETIPVFDINVSGTENIVNVCLANNIAKLVYVSSTQSFGTYAHKKEITEATKWVEHKDNTFYGICKNRAELEVWRGKEEGLNTIIVNPSLILAPKNNTIYNLKNIAEANYSFKFEGENGFVSLEDVAKICTQLMLSDLSGKQFILNAENLSYEAVYQILSASNIKDKAIRRMNTSKAKVVAKINQMRNILFSSKTFLSEETLNFNKKKFCFSNKKIVEALDYSFTPISEYAQKIK